MRYVSTGGSDAANDCGNSASPCLTIQHAVDSSTAGDELRVAAGSYSGSHTFTVNRFGIDHDYRQVVYIDRALSLRGGFTESDWMEPDPGVNVTQIDAAGDGRPVTVVDTIDERVTLEGLKLTGGNYTGLGNPPGMVNNECQAGGGEDCGGGLYVYLSALRLADCEVSGNVASTVAGHGGGIYFLYARASTISNVTVSDNDGKYGGGGLDVERQYQPLTISDSEFRANAAGRGGGILLRSNIEALITIERSTIGGNTAETGGGGGIYANLTQDDDILDMHEVVIHGNEAWTQGKGLLIESAGPYTPQARLTNILLTGNRRVDGAPQSVEDAVFALGPGFTHLNVMLAHVTAAGNSVDTFLYVEPDFRDTDQIAVTAFNILLSGFANGYAARETGGGEVSITHQKTLFHNVAQQHLTLEGTPTFVATDPLIGNPMLDADYRLQAGSAAIDQGIDAGVAIDIDGQFRPQGSAPDIGADEFLQLTAPNQVSISGPVFVLAGEEAVFMAHVLPHSATLPLNYEWTATDLDPVNHSAGLSDSVNFNWPTAGTKVVEITASNAAGNAGDSWEVTVTVDGIFSDGFESPKIQAQLQSKPSSSH